jgi:hypothetical protein
MALPTRLQFQRALKSLPMPRGRQLAFLPEHVKAPGRALTARCLAKAARYHDYRGINLQYGLLARRIGDILGRKDATLSLLVAFVRPKSVTNTEWVMVMHPQFAEALKRAGWV